jgi:hypothetical protein
LVFTTAIFGLVSVSIINQFRCLDPTEICKIGFSTGESAKTG